MSRPRFGVRTPVVAPSASASRPPSGIRHPPAAPPAPAFQPSRPLRPHPNLVRHPRSNRRPPPPGPHRQSRQKPMPEAPGRSRRPEPPESPESGNIRVARILPGLRRRSCRGRKRTGSPTPPERWVAALPERQVPASLERRAAVSSRRRELTSPRCRKPVLPKRGQPHHPGTGNPRRQSHQRHPHRQHCQGMRKPPTPHGNIPSRRVLIKFDKYCGNGFPENFQYVTEIRKEQDKDSSQAPFSD